MYYWIMLAVLSVGSSVWALLVLNPMLVALLLILLGVVFIVSLVAIYFCIIERQYSWHPDPKYLK